MVETRRKNVKQWCVVRILARNHLYPTRLFLAPMEEKRRACKLSGASDFTRMKCFVSFSPIHSIVLLNYFQYATHTYSE